MVTILRDIRDALVSLKLTVLLILFLIVLILAGTLAQVNLGIWAVQEKYFYTFVVYRQVGSVSLAVFPGGFTIGGLLLANLLAAHFYRFKLTWRKAGIWLAHAGLILLIVGQFLTGLLQDEFQLRLDQGQTKNFSESYRNVELAITDTNVPKFDEVVAIPERRCSPASRQVPAPGSCTVPHVTVKTLFSQCHVADAMRWPRPMQPVRSGVSDDAGRGGAGARDVATAHLQAGRTQHPHCQRGAGGARRVRARDVA